MGEVTNLAGRSGAPGPSNGAATAAGAADEESGDTPRAVHEHSYGSEALREGVSPR